MTYFDVISRSLGENQQNVVGLTEPDYDAYPLDFTYSMDIYFSKSITVETSTQIANHAYWGQPGKTWGQASLVWGAESDIWGAWSTVEDIVSTNYNDNGKSTMVDALKSTWAYLAYGHGAVADNATSLVSEDGRLATPTVDDQTTYFNLQFIMDAATNNGVLISELGLAVANTGNISATELPVNIDKNSFLYIIYYIEVNFYNV